MARRPIGKVAMTPTERQQRWRGRLRRQKLLAPKLEKLRVKQQRRAEREVVLAERIARAPALGSKLYGVIYMDPASRFSVWSRETGLDRAADNHYPTEFWDEIAARAPPAYKHAILLCWSTRAQLANTIRMAEDRWGFKYKTCFGWDKVLQGTGYITIDNFELLLVFSRGNPVWPAFGTQDLALYRERRSAHSEKPEHFAAMIERLWPSTPKLEMYYEPKKDTESAQAHSEKRQAAGWDLWPPV
jgi:N6-adenosine-specific RNA methylase IME4